MVLFYRIVLVFLQLTALAVVLSFEKVIGLPVLFLTFFLQFAVARTQISRFIFMTIAAFLLAVIYQIGMLLAVVVLFGLYLWFVYGGSVIESNFKRFLSGLCVVIAVIAWSAEIVFTTWVAVGLLVSSGIAIGYTLKVFLKRYGFISTPQ